MTQPTLQKLTIDWHYLDPIECGTLQTLIRGIDVGDLAPESASMVREAVMLRYIQQCLNQRAWEWEICGNRIDSACRNFARVSPVVVEASGQPRLVRPIVCQDRSDLENLLGAYISAIELSISSAKKCQ